MSFSPDPLDSVETTVEYADRRARTDSETIALVDGEREVTWAEVHHKSDRLAAGLLDRVETGEVVFEQLQNSIALYLLRLACEKAGIRLLTVPRTFRKNELQPLFDTLTPSLAIIPGNYRDFNHVAAVRTLGGESLQEIITLDGTGDAELDSLYTNPEVAPLAETRSSPSTVSQLATTSGSSGTPTCVEVPIGARVRTGLVQAERYDITSRDRIGVTTPLISGTPDALAYHAGPAIGVSVDLLERFDPDLLAQRIREGITILLAVPTVTSKLLTHVETEEIELSLSMIVNYGDTLSPSVGRHAEEQFGCRIQQAFGTADFGGIAATTTGDGTEQSLATVGQPLDGNDVLLVTDDGRIHESAGVAGDLLVDGKHRVGRPLVGNIEVEDRYFRVGVRAQFDEAGRLVLLDRTKDVVIRGGRNVYPTEVENVLANVPGVGRSAVVGVEDEIMGSRLVAFLVPSESDGRIDDDHVLNYLREEHDLAPFKLPEHIVMIENLPMVPAGHKVDKTALQERAIDDLESETP